jgi:competence protein ComEA
VVERSGPQLVAWVVVAVLIVLAGVKLLGLRDGPRASEPVRIEGGGGAGGRRAEGGLYVHVAGAVRRPGLYRVSSTARVAAALERAGGPTRRANLDVVNLAAQVEDGQQIVVPRAGAASPAPGGGAPAGSATGPGGSISLATATVEQLDSLDGIGPTLARRIVEYRDGHGGFRSVEELGEVDGIGRKRLQALRKAVTP